MDCPWGEIGLSAACPTEYRCYIKEVFRQYATAGAITLSWKGSFLRLPNNSPFWQHFTQGIYSVATIISENVENVKTFFHFFRKNISIFYY